MSDYQMLNNVHHGALKIHTERAKQYGDDVMFCMTYPFEFRLALAHYPILIYQNPDDNQLFPVTLFGFEEGENLFLNEQGPGWDAPYVPIMIQRQPFLIGYQQSSREDERQQVVSIDVNHPRVNQSSGEPVFNEQGGYSPYLEKVVKMLESIDGGHEQNRLLTEVLNQYDLVEPTTFEITLNDGSSHRLVGFSTVSEEKFEQLSGEALADLNTKGLLIPITMMMASLSQLRGLIERRNAKLS